MSDWPSFRLSANVQTIGPDHIRRNWLETVGAPDDYRRRHGLTVGLTPATRQAAFDALNRETPYVDPTRDIFEVGRVWQPPSYPDVGGGALGALGATPVQPSFRQQNDDALLAQDVGGLLSGQAPRPDPRGDALAALFGRGRAPLLPLGGGR